MKMQHKIPPSFRIFLSMKYTKISSEQNERARISERYIPLKAKAEIVFRINKILILDIGKISRQLVSVTVEKPISADAVFIDGDVEQSHIIYNGIPGYDLEPFRHEIENLTEKVACHYIPSVYFRFSLQQIIIDIFNMIFIAE